MWDPAFPLLLKDPDKTDRKVRHKGSTIDWKRVVDAVSEAVARTRPARDVCVESVLIQLPYTLGRQESEAVTRWFIGDERAVRVVHGEPSPGYRDVPPWTVGNGRHRLWGTRAQFDGYIPVMSNMALYLHDIYPLTPDVSYEGPAEARAAIDWELTWWRTKAPLGMVEANQDYIENLSDCHTLMSGVEIGESATSHEAP